MLRPLLVIALLAVPVSGALAENKENSFCRGYIIKALADFPVAGLSRVDLWLGWNATVARTGSQGMLNAEEYKAGRDRYDSLKSANNSAQIIEIMDEECEMGQNEGIVWW